MAITYPINIPASPKPSRITIRARTSVAVTRSPFTGEEQVQKHQGQWWEAEITLPPMLKASANKWTSFLTKLRGMEGTFLMGDPDAVDPVGTASSAPGTPVVNGSSQTGDTLNIDGLPSNTTGYLVAGDYIQLSTGTSARLYKILDNVDSSSTGAAAVTLFPNITDNNKPSDNAPIIVSSAKGLFRLTVNEMEWNIQPLQYNITFPCKSVV